MILTADQPVTVNFETKEMVGRGSATLRYGEVLLTADEIRFNQTAEAITATGHVALTTGPERLLARVLFYNLKTQTMHAEDVRVGRHPFYVSGLSADGPVTRIVIRHAEVTYNEPGRWRPTIRADTIIYSPGHYLRLGNSRVGVAGIAMIPLWHVGEKVDASILLSNVSFTGGYRSSLGAIGTASLRIPVTTELKAGGDLSVFTSRGVMAGPGATYRSDDGSDDLLGSARSGFISDYGKRLTDILGNPVPRDRGFVAWTHQQQLTDNLTLNGDVNWWKDSDILRDFNSRAFYAVQEPDNFVESVYTGGNYLASAFTRFQPDSFEPVQERLPELSFDVLPVALGGGFYGRSESSAVSLLENPPGGGPKLASTRLDMFYGLSRPFSQGDWASFTPVVGGRVTRYTDTIGAAAPGGYTRTVGEVGFDALLRSSGTFGYENKLWDIDGLRHLLTPHVSYRYIPNADAGQRYIPDIDRISFTPDLEPLELGDLRSIDSLHPVNTLRLGVDNTIQTRDPEYGSRDLLTFDADEDLLFHRQPGDRDFSQVHTDFNLKPEKWLDVGVATIFTPQTLAVRELETGLTLRDGDKWSLHLGSDFLRHENDTYVGELRVRLNEMYSLHFLSLYDERHHNFPQQSIALEENLVNTWAIRYTASFSSGPNRSGHFGINAQVDLIRF